MRDLTLDVGQKEYLQLNTDEQTALRGWVKALLDCDPDLIESVAVPAVTDPVNRTMEISIYVREQPARPTLLGERHHARISAPAPDGLLRRLADICNVPLDAQVCELCDTVFHGDESQGHLKVEAAEFPDGCTFTNYRCTATDRWGWNREDIENEHGHELPAGWHR